MTWLLDILQILYEIGVLGAMFAARNEYIKLKAKENGYTNRNKLLIFAFMRRLTTEEFIKRARAVHGDRYDYSKVVYVNRRTKVCIICPDHGEFWQLPDAHILQRQLCKYCAGREFFRVPMETACPEGAKAVPLSQGKYALVDEEDYERVSGYLWCISHGYAYNNAIGFMHRFIMNTPEGMHTDHKDLNRLNNRKSNLRVCTQRENACNKPKSGGTSSNYKGVDWHKRSGKWRSKIGVENSQIHIGLFSSEEEAARAYDEAAKKYHKDFAILNY